jgi:MFS family permease
MTLFLRQTLLFQGELEKELKTARTELARVEGRSAVDAETEMDRLLASVLPGRLEKAAQESELRVALLFALVGLGVGLGSIAAGYLSGHRVELGLVPIGALSIVLFTFLPAWLAERPLVFIGCLFGIGVGAGFYLVPLYTLLQHRAPKESKGNVVSASNFLNVLGGIVSVGAFYLIALALDGLLGARLTELDVAADKSLLPTFVADLESQMRIPRLLFLAACVCTVGAVLILVRRLPDFFVRSAIWLSAWGHNPLRTSGVEHMPLDGAVILVTNCSTFASALDLIAAVDRHPNIVLIEEPGSERDQHLLRTLAARSCLLAIDGRASDGALWQQASQLGAHALMRGEMMALTAPRDSARQNAQRLFEDWRQSGPATVVPVYCSRGDGPPTGRRPFVVFGNPLDGQTDLAAARAAIDRLAPGQTN